MAADLGLVVHAAQGDPHELAAERPGDRLAEAGLADAGRPDERDDGAVPAAVTAGHRRVRLGLGVVVGVVGGIGGVEAALGPQPADGEELDDAVLDLLEAVVVGVEDGPGIGQVEVVVGARGPRQLEHRVQPGLDPAVLGVLRRHALELVDLLLDRGGHALGQLVGDLGESRPVRVGGLALVVAQLLADRRHLLAQQELALGLLHAVGDVAADALGQLELGEGLLGPGQDLLDPLGDVGRLQQLDLALDVEVGPPAGRVGQRAGLVDARQQVVEAPTTDVLGDGAERGPQLAAQLEGALGGLALLDGVGGEPEGLTGTDDAGADAGPVDGPDHERRGAVRQRPGGLDAGDDADRGVAALDTGDEQQVPVVAGRRGRDLGLGGLERDGEHHAGEDHAGGQRQDGQGDGAQIGHGVLVSEAGAGIVITRLPAGS